MIFAKQFDQITKADVDGLVSNQIPEGRELDYKEQLPGTTLEQKRGYLYDLASFANTSGGLMIFGIRDQRDPNNNPTGVPVNVLGLSGINADKEMQWLEQLQLAGVERRVPGVRFKAIEGFPNGPVILVYIPKSWASPHIVTLGDIHRFYARGERGKYLMDWNQIQSAFLFSESIAERIRNFRYDRLAKIEAGQDVPVELEGNARAVLHIVPISALQPRASVDIVTLKQNPHRLLPLGFQVRPPGDSNHRLNLDGFVRSSIGRDTYTLVFRTGAMEAVDTYFLREGRIPFPVFEFEVARSTKAYLSLLTELGVEPPILVMLALLRVRGLQVFDEHLRKTIGSGFDRDNVLLPDVLVEELPCDVPKLLKPVFDTM